MANEATLHTEYLPPIAMTCANATGIERGTVLKMTDPATAIIASGTNDAVAGIASGEKIASDGITKVGVYRSGIWRMYISGSVTVGDPVGTIASFANHVRSIRTVARLSGSVILGTALETGTNGQTILVELNPTAQTAQDVS